MIHVIDDRDVLSIVGGFEYWGHLLNGGGVSFGDSADSGSGALAAAAKVRAAYGTLQAAGTATSYAALANRTSGASFSDNPFSNITNYGMFLW